MLQVSLKRKGTRYGLSREAFKRTRLEVGVLSVFFLDRERDGEGGSW